MKGDTYTFPVVVEHDAHGYVAFCRDIDGCYAQGKTLREVKKNIKEVIELCLEDMQAERVRLPVASAVQVVNVTARVCA